MIKSMTGYGRNVFAGNNRRYTVEIKTVNHRYNDISIKMPRYLIALEDKLRQLISQNISRGKVDVFINIENLDIKLCGLEIKFGNENYYPLYSLEEYNNETVDSYSSVL